MWAKPVTRVGPYSALNSRNRLPSTTREITSRTSYGVRVSDETTPYSCPGRPPGSSVGITGQGGSGGRAQGGDDGPHHRQGLAVVGGQMVRDARSPGVQVAAAELLGASPPRR